MVAEVDRSLCTGCELCVETCPAVFEMDDSLARSKIDVVPDADESACREAADQCPVAAIILLSLIHI